MTPPKSYEIHEAGPNPCPRLCYSFNRICDEHDRHACPPCTGSSMVAVKASELEELVEAARAYVGKNSAGNHLRLNAATRPFRRGGKP